MRSRLVAGNWKMHGGRAANRTLLAAIVAADVECAVCVPFPYLEQAAQQLLGTRVALAAQTLSEHASGAYTGEIAAAMLVEFGCRYVLVGHSERRQLYGEGDAQVAAKFRAARAGGITPILCLGETLAEREAGRTEEVVARQLDAVLAQGGIGEAVVAYEPVWAIGTGRSASPAQAQEVHGYLRKRLPGATRILYGGSVKPDNAAAIFEMPDVDGGLIGGASLKAQEFIAICKVAQQKG